MGDVQAKLDLKKPTIIGNGKGIDIKSYRKTWKDLKNAKKKHYKEHQKHENILLYIAREYTFSMAFSMKKGILVLKNTSISFHNCLLSRNDATEFPLTSKIKSHNVGLQLSSHLIPLPLVITH